MTKMEDEIIESAPNGENVVDPPAGAAGGLEYVHDVDIRIDSGSDKNQTVIEKVKDNTDTKKRGK